MMCHLKKPWSYNILQMTYFDACCNDTSQDGVAIAPEMLDYSMKHMHI